MPRCESRTGAAHLRRAAPCQDASGLWQFRDGAGDPIQVLVVSDGHGGSRYVRSDVGSRLACQVALRTVERTLGASRTGRAGAEAEWRQWLAETLPRAIVEAWLEEVRRHWQDQGAPGGSGSPDGPEASSAGVFSPIPYGATLGLLVLTPRWWGHTGLGDWDLVRLEASGAGRIVSEEPQAAGGGEATYSLCMQAAASHFAPRSGLQALAPEEPPFSLLLSTDGIRKSCGTDADYLTLAQYLVELSVDSSQPGAAELSGALDHISSQGSGDDVSVAIGRWVGRAQLPVRPPGSGPGKPLIVQPPPPPVAAVARDSASQSPAAAPPAGSETAVVSRSGGTGQRRRAHPPFWRVLLLGGGLFALLAGAGLLLFWWRGWRPFAQGRPETPSLTAVQQRQLQGQVNRLCGHAAAGLGAKPEAGGGGNAPASGSSAGGSNGAGGASPQTAPPPARELPRPGMAAPAPQSAAKVAEGAATGEPPGSSAPPLASTATAAAVHASMPGTLAGRRSVFLAILAGGEPEVRRRLNARAADPLSALIAWSRLQPSLAAGLPPLDEDVSGGGLRGIRWPWLPVAPRAERLPSASALSLCSPLSQELRRQWALSREVAERLAPGAAGSRPTGAGLPGQGRSDSRTTPPPPSQKAGQFSTGGEQPGAKPSPASTPGPSTGSGRQDSADPLRSSR